MEPFSQRFGFKPNKSIMQAKSMDDDLRNRIWNALFNVFWMQISGIFFGRDQTQDIIILINDIWNKYFKKQVDTIPVYSGQVKSVLKEYYFQLTWNEVYDFLEFIINNYRIESENKRFINICNHVLKEEHSAYRIIEGKISPITSEVEIKEIEEAINDKDNFKTISEHLGTALVLLSDRKTPDYRNSIKESISAVESICKILAKDEKAKFEDALKILENNIGLHGALKKAYSSLYGYTSDADGIRHALMDEPNLSFEDAKFMLVICSAFVNYLKEKIVKISLVSNK